MGLGCGMMQLQQYGSCCNFFSDMALSAYLDSTVTDWRNALDLNYLKISKQKPLEIVNKVCERNVNINTAIDSNL